MTEKMSGYNYNNWRRRERDSGSQRSRGQNSNYWNSSTFNSYPNYSNQFQYPQGGFSQQWNSWSSSNQNQYGSSYSRERDTPSSTTSHNNSRHSFNSSQGHGKTTGHSSSRRSQSPSSESRSRHSHEKHASSQKSQSPSAESRIRSSHHSHEKSSSSSSKSHHSRKAQSPPLGSEEARKKTLAQATDKIKSCLRSFKNEKSEVLDNLLSNVEKKKDESLKSKSVRIQKPSCTQELRLSSKDLKGIGMVNTSETVTSVEENEIENPEFQMSESLNRGDKTERSNSSCLVTSKEQNPIKSVRESVITSEDSVNQESKRSSFAQNSIVNLTGPRSRASSSSTHGNMSNDSTHAKNSFEHSAESKESQQKCTVKDLKQRIIQQFLKMSKNNLKDLINNPRTRKFEFAMSHLMKEHRMLLSRELRGLAQARIREQDVENHGLNEPEFKTQSLLDTDIAINLSHLPQEIIEKLGNFLQLNLLDSAESADFHPNIPVVDESSVHDIQNIEALQVALFSEENIKREIEEKEVKQEVEENINVADEETRIESNTIINQQNTESDIETQDFVKDVGSKNNDQVDSAVVDEREVVYEEGGAAKKSKAVTHKFSPYVPLGKGFMNRTGEFGNLFCEFPDFLGIESSEPEGEAMDEQDNNAIEIGNTKHADDQSGYKTNGQSILETSSEGMKQQKIINETGFVEPSNTERFQSSCYPALLPNEILSDEVTKNSDMTTGEPVVEKSIDNSIENSALEDIIGEPTTGFNSGNEGNQITNSYNGKNKNMLPVPDDTVVKFEVGSSIQLDSSKSESMSDAIERLERACANIENDVGLSMNEDETIDCSDKNFDVTENKVKEAEIEKSELLKENADAGDAENIPQNIGNNYAPNDNADMFNKNVETAPTENNSDFKEIAGDESSKYKMVVDDLIENKEENTIPDNGNEKVVGTEADASSAEGPAITNIVDTDNIIMQEECGESELSIGQENSNDTGKDEVSKENEVTNFKDNDAEDISVEDLYGDLSDYCSNTGEIHNSAVKEVQSENYANEMTAVIDVPHSEATEILDKDFANTPSGPTCNETIPKEDDSTMNDVGMQMEVPLVEDKDKLMEVLPAEITDTQMEMLPAEVTATQMEMLPAEVTAKQMEMFPAEVTATQMEMLPAEVTAKQMEMLPAEVTATQMEMLPAEVTETQMEMLPAEVTETQMELPSDKVSSNSLCEDEIAEIYRCNVVVKAEKDDEPSECGITQEPMQGQINNDADIARDGDKSQNVHSISQSFESNQDSSVKNIDTCTQTESSDELDTNEIQRLLQLLEKSSQLSPQLAKLLKDHFSSNRVIDDTGLSKVPGIQPIEKSPTVSLKEKSPSFLVQPLGSTMSPRALVQVPESHGLVINFGSETSVQQNSYVESVESGFRSSLLIGNKDKKSCPKRSKISRPDVQEKSLEAIENHKDDYVNKRIEGSSPVDPSSPNIVVSNSQGVNESLCSSTRKDVRDAPSGPHTRYVFLKMLEIDKEIQRLMEVKLELYKKLQLSLEADSPCPNRGGNISPKTRVLHYSSPSTSKELASSQNVNGRTVVQNNSNAQQLHISFPTANSHDIIGSSFVGDKTASASTPMVMLPMDFVLNTSSEHSSLQRHKTNERLKTFDTSVVEAVLNSFNIPDSHPKGDESSILELANNNTQNRHVPENNTEPEMEDNNNANKTKRYNSPRLSASRRDSQQLERSSPPKTITPKKQFQKSKSDLVKEQQTPDRKKQPNTIMQVGIVTRNKSVPTTNQVKNQAVTSSETTLRRSARSDLSKTPTKEQRNTKQTDTIDNKENATDKTTRNTRQKYIQVKNEEDSTQHDIVPEDKNSKRQKQTNVKSSDEMLHRENSNVEEKNLRTTRQKQSIVKYEEEVTESNVEDRNIRTTRQKLNSVKLEEDVLSLENSIIEDKKDKRSTKSKLKNEKQLEGENVGTSSRPKRNTQNKSDLPKSCDQIASPSSNSITRNRRETRTRPSKELEQAEDSLEQANNKKGTRLSRRQNSTTCEETDISDEKSTRKRKISNKADTYESDCVETSSHEEQVQARSRRSFGKTSYEHQDFQYSINHENTESLNRKKKKLSKVDDDTQVQEEVQYSVESIVPLKKHTKIVTPSSLGQSQNNENQKRKDFLENNPTPDEAKGLSPVKNKRHINGAQKRKSEESEGPPAKIQRPNPKPDLLQWNLQDCFVMVKPLAIDLVDESRQPENSVKKQTDTAKERLQVQRPSTCLDDIPVLEIAKKGKGKKQELDGCFRIDLPDTSDEMIEPLDSCDNQQDPLGGIPDTPQPPELHIETYGNVNSSPMQLPPDLLMQSNSPGQMQGQCLLPEIAIQDENSISTLISDTISVMSDGEQSYPRRMKNDDKNETDLLSQSAEGKDDCDRDSSYSYDITQEGREGTSSRASKHKSSRKHKKDRRTDGIERLTFEAHEGPILDIKTVGRHVLAASEDGNVYCYSLKSGKFKRKYEGHNAAVTCLSVIECSNSSNFGSDIEGADVEQNAPDLFFTGSLDEHLRHFSFKTGELVQNPINIGSPVQCMDQNWGVVYIGTKRGEVVRYNIKTSSLIDEPVKIGKEAVLTLKATKEGPRQVLIVGTRNRPITVRDAATGLLLRTMNNNWSNTVYSIVLTTSVVYCGTKTGIIPAVEFSSGEEICRFQAGSGTGVVCMRIYNNLLFAASYDGNIYVFSIQDKKQVSCIPGPGKMLLCMDIVKNRIIAGSKDSNKLEAWGFPQEIRNHLKEAKHR